MSEQENVRAQPEAPPPRPQQPRSDTAAERNAADAPTYREGPARARAAPAAGGAAPAARRPRPSEAQSPKQPANSGGRFRPLGKTLPDSQRPGWVRRRAPSGTATPKAPTPAAANEAARPAGGKSFWTQPIAHTEEAVRFKPNPGLAAVFQPVARAESNPAAWAQKGPPQMAAFRPVVHEGPAVAAWSQEGPVKIAVFGPVAKVESKPAAWAQGGPVPMALLKPVVHEGPPVLLGTGPAQAALFRPVEKKTAPMPFFLGAAAIPFFLPPLAADSIWVFKKKEKAKKDKKSSQEKATTGIAAGAEAKAAPAAEHQIWTVRGFVEMEADAASPPTASSALPAQAYPYLNPANAAESLANATPYPSVALPATSWTTRAERITATAEAVGQAAPAFGSAKPGYEAEADARSAIPEHPVVAYRTDRPKPLALKATHVQAIESPAARVLKPQSKTSDETKRKKARAKEKTEPEPWDRPVSPERLPPSQWYSGLGYAMEFMIIDAMCGTQLAAQYIANNKALQALGKELQPLYEADDLRYPSLEDIVESMGYVATHVSRYYKNQQKAKNFTNVTLLPEVGLLHDYPNHSAARILVNNMLKERVITPQQLVYLARLGAHEDESIWEDKSVWGEVLAEKLPRDKELRKTLLTVTQSATLYTDIRPDGKRNYYVASAGIRPDIISINWNNDQKGMSDLVNAMEIIARGPHKRRNLQEFQRWVNEPVPYKGREIPAREAVILFCEEHAAGNVDATIYEAKTHPGNNFNRAHGFINKAIGHIPEPGSNIRGTHLGTDIAVTVGALSRFIEKVVDFDREMDKKTAREMRRGIRKNTNAEFIEIRMGMLADDTPDPLHAEAEHIVIPAPAFRAHSVNIGDLAEGWRKHRERVKETGRREIMGSAAILTYTPEDKPEDKPEDPVVNPSVDTSENDDS